jgi:hypothetical protein
LSLHRIPCYYRSVTLSLLFSASPSFVLDNQLRPELDYIWSLIRIDAPLDIPMTPFLLKKEDMPVVPESAKKVITMEKFLSSW